MNWILVKFSLVWCQKESFFFINSETKAAYG
jgi:hypothetical protein